MTSRRRTKTLLAIVVAAVVVIVLWSRLVGGSTTDSRPEQPASHAPDSASTLQPQLSGPEAGNPAGNPGSSSPPRSPAAAVVDRFAKAFVSRAPHRQWISQLRPLVTDELLEGYRYTSDRARPSLSTVTSVTSRSAATANPQVLDITYATGLVLRCTATPAPDGAVDQWRIASVTPRQQPGQHATDPGTVADSDSHA